MEADQADSLGDRSKPPLELSPELSKFIENMGLYYEEGGVPRIGGRILGLLLIAREPLAPEQIAETLRVSRSSISTNLRILQMSGWIEKTAIPGERCDYYLFAEDAWERSLQIRLQGVLELKELAQQGLSAVEESHPGRQRLKEMVHWASQIEQVYAQLLERWQPQNKVTV